MLSWARVKPASKVQHRIARINLPDRWRQSADVALNISCFSLGSWTELSFGELLFGSSILKTCGKLGRSSGWEWRPLKRVKFVKDYSGMAVESGWLCFSELKFCTPRQGRLSALRMPVQEQVPKPGGRDRFRE